MKPLSDETRPAISVVILAYRANIQIKDFVQQVVTGFCDAKINDYELVLVANYDVNSRDNDPTPEIIRRMANEEKRIISVTLPKRGMMGWDLQQGLQVTKGKAIAIIDGDGQMPPMDLVRLFRVMNSGEFQFVKTYRIERGDGTFRLVMSQVFNGLFRLLFPACHYKDINSKPKLILRSALEQMNLTCDGWFIDGEIILEAMRLDLPFAEIPTKFKKNEWRGSFVNVGSIFEMFASMTMYRIKIWFRDKNKQNFNA